ncbi:MAG: hypothetical protein IE879_07720 [Sulfuricurvum sp.]|nr:hypothetical protein [Campylobacterales bacterium]MBD3806948.1 hypothetical protein [Sulfuricurvum sp.]
MTKLTIFIRDIYRYVPTLLFFLFIIPLHADQITYTNLTETIYKKNQHWITIQAEKKVDNFNDSVIKAFFNRKNYMRDNFYYENGILQFQNYQISFKYLFIYANTIYLTEASGELETDYSFRAKEAIIYPNYIEFKKFRYQKGKKHGSKIRFKFLTLIK